MKKRSVKPKREMNYFSLKRGNVSTPKTSLSSPSDSSKSTNNTMLMFEAVKLGKDALVDSLIYHGAPCFIIDRFGASPLYYAARYNRESIFKLLLSNNKDLIDYPTKMLRTPLHIASYYGHANIVKILIENKANINRTDSLGMSALHWAAENNHPKVVRLLLEAGANRARTNIYRKTAFCLALAKNNYDVCEILQDMYKLNSEINCKVTNNRNKKLRSNQLPNERVQENETIKLFEQHGIKLLPVDQSTTIANALNRGQTAVLTEAGKLALKKTESMFLRSISNMTSNASCPLTRMSPPKKKKVEDDILSIFAEIESCPMQTEDKIISSKTKFPKVDLRQSTNFPSHKKSASSCASNMSATRSDNHKLEPKISKSHVSVNCYDQESANNLNKSLELELQNKTAAIRDMKKQLDMSMQLTNYYKNKFEIKEKEAELYKSQLLSLSRMLTNSGFKIVNVDSS